MQMNTAVPLYNSRIINTYLEYLNAYYPRVSIESILEYAGMKPYEVEDPAHWFSQDQVNRFQEILFEKTQNPNLALEAGRFTILSKKIGAAKQYTLGLMSPASVYMMMGKLYRTMSRGAVVTSERLSANEVKLTATPVPEIREGLFQCKNRIGTFESLAKLFTGEFAKVEHPQCYHRGDKNCCYIISWKLTPSILWARRRNVIGLLAAGIILFSHLFMPLNMWIMSSLVAIIFALSAGGISLYAKQKELAATVESQGNTATDLLDVLQVRYNHALLMQEIGNASTSILRQEAYIDAVMQAIEKRLEFDRGMIMLEKKDRKRLLQYAASYGHTPEQLALLKAESFDLEDPKSKGVFVRVFREHKSFLVEDSGELMASLSDHSKKFVEKIASKSFICVPIVYKEKSLGVIAVDNLFSNKPLTNSDLNILKAIASQVAVGITNADAFKNLQEKEETLRMLYESTKKTEQLYSSLLFSSPDAIIVYDSRGGIQYLNPAFTRIFGWTFDEAVKMSATAKAAGDGRTIFDGLKPMVSRQQTGLNVESKQFTKTGELLDVIISASHFKDHAGSPGGVLFIIHDISEKKRLEEQLLQAQKMEALGTLVAGVAHEINNPVNGIINYAQLMADQEDAQNENHELARRIIAEGERIAAIVNNLLSISRTSQGERAIENIHDLLFESLSLIEPQFRKEGIGLQVDVPEVLPDVLVNGQEIQQVFLNILSNAQYALNQKKMTAARGKLLSITAKAVIIEDTEFIRIIFFDNGTGIPDEMISKICNPFFSTKPSGKGTGLGLSISHEIVKDHGGNLLFESIEGEYTKVIMDLKTRGDTQ